MDIWTEWCEAQVLVPWGWAWQHFFNKNEAVRFCVKHNLSTHISQHIHSVASTQITIGCGLKWTVDMFHEPREMVEENDHWNELVKPKDPEFSSAG